MCLTHVFGIVTRGMPHGLGPSHVLHFRVSAEDIQAIWSTEGGAPVRRDGETLRRTGKGRATLFHLRSEIASRIDGVDFEQCGECGFNGEAGAMLQPSRP